MKMVSLDGLYKALEEIDVTAKQGDHPLKGLAYELTYNQYLGSSNNRNGFLVIAPCGGFSTTTKVQGEMPLQRAFKDMISDGLKASEGQDKVFIDIAELQEDSIVAWFFEPKDKDEQSVIWHLCNELNELFKKSPTTRPVIRFLIGVANNRDIKEEFKTSFQDLFSDPKSKGPRITNPNAVVHIGVYRPSVTADEKVLEPILEKIVNNLPSYMTTLASLSGYKLKELVKSIILNFRSVISWNHAKILAIGGKVLMTGGQNYWKNYTTAESYTIDLQARVAGDAAISAHKYSDSFWRYLNKRSSADATSMRATIQGSAFNWDTPDSPQPQAELFAKTHDQTSEPKASQDSSIPVLTVNRVDQSLITDSEILVSAQVIDALRDIFLNVLYSSLKFAMPSVLNDIKDNVEKKKKERDLLSTFSKGIEGLSDVFMSQVLSSFKLSPAIWASRYARTYAIANAQHSVLITGQMFAQWLATDKSIPGYTEWMGFVAKANKCFGFDEKTTAEAKWDGKIWPFDHLHACAKALLNFSKSSDDTAGIYCVLTQLKSADQGWGDIMSASDIASRIAIILAGIIDAGDEDPLTKANQIVEKRFKVRRISGKLGWTRLHSKSYCIDGKLLYVGSDNIYPSYNEEHGIWVENKETIEEWFSTYWTPLWKHELVEDVVKLEQRGKS